MSKKNKKKAWKPVDLTTVLGETRAVSTAWADEAEFDERDREIAAAKISALPTAPRSARGTDDERVPNAPPYVAYITNLPFEVIEEDVHDFFADFQIESVRLPKNDATGKFKGYGYVEFAERQGLIEALQISDKSIKGRRIRIDVAENNDRDRGYGRDRMGRDRMGMGRDRDDYDPERTMGDWRSSSNRTEPEGDRMRSGGRGGYGSGGFGDRDRDGGFGAPRESDNREGGWREGMGSGTGTSDRFGDRDRDSYRSRGFGDRDGYDRDRGSRYGDRDGDRYGDRPRYGDRDGDRPRYGDRDGDRPRYGDRDGDRPRYGDRDGDRPRYGDRSYGDRDGDRPRYGDRDGDRPRYGDRERDEDRDRNPRREDGPPAESSGGEPTERRRLVLQPRTKPIENPLPPPPAPEEEKKPEPAPVPRASIFGAAKPVDTAAREREIEERLAREKERAPRRDDRDKSTDNTRAKDGSDHGDDPKKVEPAPPPKENAWTRRPRIEPGTKNGDASQNSENDRSASPGRYDSKKDRPLSHDRSRAGSRPEDSNTRNRNYANSKDRDGEGKREFKDNEDNRSNRSGSRDKRDNKENLDRARDDGSNTDRPSRRDHSNEDKPRLPKYEEKPIPNFAASNKFAFLNEDDDGPGDD